MKKVILSIGICMAMACGEQSTPPNPVLEQYCIIQTDAEGRIIGSGVCKNSTVDDEWKGFGPIFAPQPAYPNPTTGGITQPYISNGLDSLIISFQKIPLGSSARALTKRFIKPAAGTHGIQIPLDSLRNSQTAGRGLYRVNLEAYKDGKKHSTYGSIDVR